MIDDRTKMLIESVRKLLRRGATANVRRILGKTHNADTAAIIESLEGEESLQVFHLVPSIDDRASVLSYLPKEHQRLLISFLDSREVQKLVSLMEPDDAADFLGRLSEEESKDILASMVKEDSEEVADLMGYPEDSAGGLMSPDFLSLRQDITVEQAIQEIQNDEEDRVAFYIYVVDDHRRLVGVLSLKQLLLSKKTETLQSLMHTDVISVNINTSQEQVAKVVERYDFLAVPVVDANHLLEGVITVDDVLDVIREEAEGEILAMGQAGWGGDSSVWDHFKSRFPWLLLALLGGALCFSIVYMFIRINGGPQEDLSSLGMVAAFIPVLLSLGSTTGSQSSTVVVGAIRSGRMDMGRVKEYLKKEFVLSLLFSAIFGLTVFLAGQLIFPQFKLTPTFAYATSFQIIISMMIGSGTPVGMYKAGMDPNVASVPLFALIADVTAMAVLFGLIHLG